MEDQSPPLGVRACRGRTQAGVAAVATSTRRQPGLRSGRPQTQIGNTTACSQAIDVGLHRCSACATWTTPFCTPIHVPHAPQAMIKPPKRDLPAFWSVRTHGQPFNDERLAGGASNFYRLAQPAGLNGSSPDAVGPATMQQAALRKWVGASLGLLHGAAARGWHMELSGRAGTGWARAAVTGSSAGGGGGKWNKRGMPLGARMRLACRLGLCTSCPGGLPQLTMYANVLFPKPLTVRYQLLYLINPAIWCCHRSLETGRRMFTSMADLSPLPPGTFRSVKELPALSDAEREFLLNKLTPYQRIHALYHCLDRDSTDKTCPPWPLVGATAPGGIAAFGIWHLSSARAHVLCWKTPRTRAVYPGRWWGQQHPASSRCVRHVSATPVCVRWR